MDILLPDVPWVRYLAGKSLLLCSMHDEWISCCRMCLGLGTWQAKVCYYVACMMDVLFFCELRGKYLADMLVIMQMGVECIAIRHFTLNTCTCRKMFEQAYRVNAQRPYTLSRAWTHCSHPKQNLNCTTRRTYSK